MGKMRIGLQLYTVRDELAGDFAGTLRKVAAMGYEGVEFAGYGGMAAQELKGLLDELGLEAAGSHVNIARIRHHLREEITYLQTIRAQYLVCPCLNALEFQSEEDWRKQFAEFNEVGRICAGEGLTFCYHNHAFEFKHTVDGQQVFDALYDTVLASLLQMEMDTGWVHYVGRDVAACISRYTGRLPLVHLKDYEGTDEEGKLRTTVVGQGVLPLQEILRASREAGARWVIVEQDRCYGPSLPCAGSSLQWLLDHGSEFLEYNRIGER
ncbi:MAG: Xylose isomerase domain protein barrel [Paenibacillaceae bacterium]|jgi:sugar phosphate isomerase/epimerase|nr:Xylose isomerase domain protein barrel [Paenibacillaceae bacterium]